MREQTRKPRFQQGNTDHIDVARAASVRMHNRHRRALVGNATDYICIMASAMSTEGTPELPDEWGRRVRRRPAEPVVCTGTLINYPPSPIM